MPYPPEPTRVLVVDDRAEMAEMIADDLNDRGYEATAVTSGEEALHILRTQRVDVLVTDLRMPGVDGFDVVRVSVELDPSRTINLMTANGTLDTALEATGRGVFQYMIKPFRLDALARVLEQAHRV
jgi:DNA-binding NtrC family response regulator